MNKEPLWGYATDEIHYFYYYCLDNKPLTSQVRGAHCEVQTEFFLLVFMAWAQSALAINKRGKNQTILTIKKYFCDGVVHGLMVIDSRETAIKFGVWEWGSNINNITLFDSVVVNDVPIDLVSSAKY